MFDKIVDARMDRKGILHTISFTHLNDVIERSRHANLFVSNDIKYSGGVRKTTDVIETFKASSVLLYWRHLRSQRGMTLKTMLPDISFF